MTKKSFSHEQLNGALMATQDLMERLGGCPFYPLKDISKIIYENADGKLSGDGIYIGVPQREFTKQRISMFRTLEEALKYKIEESDDHKDFKIELQGVPIYIKLITRNYKFFKNPDIKFWGVTEFLMPNPFDEYWKARGIVR